MSWEGSGPIEATSSTTTFPGFTGHFQGKRRDAVATGTVVVDGATLVEGSTANAEIETLEDKNITTAPEAERGRSLPRPVAFRLSVGLTAR